MICWFGFGVGFFFGRVLFKFAFFAHQLHFEIVEILIQYYFNPYLCYNYSIFPRNFCISAYKENDLISEPFPVCSGWQKADLYTLTMLPWVFEFNNIEFQREFVHFLSLSHLQNCAASILPWMSSDRQGDLPQRSSSHLNQMTFSLPFARSDNCKVLVEKAYCIIHSTLLWSVIPGVP